MKYLRTICIWGVNGRVTTGTNQYTGEGPYQNKVFSVMHTIGSVNGGLYVSSAFHFIYNIISIKYKRCWIKIIITLV